MAQGDQAHIALRNKNTKSWDQTLAYDAGVEVRYTDGLLYTSNTSINANTAWVEGTGPQTWIRSSGQVTAWVQANRYFIGYQVTYSGILWRAIANTTAGQAFNTAQWRNVVGILPSNEWEWDSANKALLPLTRNTHRLGSSTRELGQIHCESYGVADAGGNQRARLYGVASDSSNVNGGNLPASASVILNLEANTDFKLKSNGTTVLTYGEDEDQLATGHIDALSVTTTGLIPAAIGGSSIGGTTTPFDSINCQEYRFNPTTAVSFTMPICIAVLRANAAGSVQVSSTTNISCSKTGTGQYNIAVSGSLAAALTSSSTYWYTATTIGDGDNVASCTGRATTGLTVQTHDFNPSGGTTSQDSEFVVQVWIYDASI